MAKFCTKCGTPLVDGQVCSCQQIQQEVAVPAGQTNPVQQAAPAQQTNSVQQAAPVQQTNSVQQMAPVQQANSVQQAAPVQQANSVQQAAPVQQTVSQQPTAQENAAQYQEQFNQAKEKSSAYLQQLFFLFMGFLKHPVTTIHKFVTDANFTMGLGLIGIQSMIVGLFSVAVFGKLNSYISTAMAATGVLNSLSGGSASGALNIIKIPLMKAFFITGISSFAFSCILAGILFLLVKLFKGTTTYKHMIAAVGIRCVGIVPVVAVSILLFYFNMVWGIALFFTGSLLGICFLIYSTQVAATIKSDLIPYIVFAASVILLIVFFLGAKSIFPMYLPQQLKSITNNLDKILKSGDFLSNFIL